MDFVIGIPARMGSTRLPGKPLVDICGVPMIAHVYERVKMAINDESKIYIASPDKEIWEFCLKYNIPYVKVPDTPTPARKPGERIYRMAKELYVAPDCTIITVQGDEPFINPNLIKILLSYPPDFGEVHHFMTSCKNDDKDNPSEVKVLCDRHNRALYFTRLPIQANKHICLRHNYYKQVCIFSMLYDDANIFYNSKLFNMDAPDAIEMNAMLEMGYEVSMKYADYDTKSVDTIEDLNQARMMMENDALFQSYKDKYAKG